MQSSKSIGNKCCIVHYYCLIFVECVLLVLSNGLISELNSGDSIITPNNTGYWEQNYSVYFFLTKECEHTHTKHLPQVVRKRHAPKNSNYVHFEMLNLSQKLTNPVTASLLFLCLHEMRYTDSQSYKINSVSKRLD